jgi:aminoglycoside phosphotransferase
MQNEIASALARAGFAVHRDGGSVEVEEIPTLAHSFVARIDVRLPGDSPQRFIFKRSRPGPAAYLTVREARFYRDVAPALPAGLAPRCFFADDDGAVATLLLDDLSGSHRRCLTECPTFEEATAFVEALAELHATSIGQPTLAAGWARGLAGLGHHTIEDRLVALAALVPRFVDSAGDDADAATAQFLSGLGSAPSALATFVSERTVMHGDAHYWNALYSGDGATLLDWGNACLGPAEVDLAHALALNLPRTVGRDWETPLLDRYRRRLEQRGIRRDAGDLRERYRRAVLYATLVPLGHRAAGVPSRVWRGLLANGVAAARDLEVTSLL